MQVVRLCDEDGRIRGSYVYLLLASDAGEAIHAKVGQSDMPLERLNELQTACPFIPDTFAVVKMPSRYLARRLERALHAALHLWSAHGEWFRFAREDRAAFNEAWKVVFSKHALPSWPLKWEKINVAEYQKARQVRMAYFQRTYARRGRAFKDFARAAT